jgi:hypothetical protein
MKLDQHPEHAVYLRHLDQDRRYRQAVNAWLQDAETRSRVETLVAALASLLQSYNRILWQQFPYCSQCLGGCCVVGATDLKPVDYVALSWLEEELPIRPERTGLDERACIYLTPEGCSWPGKWRPLKCALFYCLGSGASEIDASDARYGEITAALEKAIGPRLEQLLPEHAPHLTALLPDPVAFADALSTALDQEFFALLYERVPELRQPAAPRAKNGDPLGDARAFIARASEQLWAGAGAGPPGNGPTAEQFLSDLETVAWIIEGRPGNSGDLLEEMGKRYPPVPQGTASPDLWQQMRIQLEQLATTLRERKPAAP